MMNPLQILKTTRSSGWRHSPSAAHPAACLGLRLVHPAAFPGWRHSHLAAPLALLLARRSELAGCPAARSSARPASQRPSSFAKNSAFAEVGLVAPASASGLELFASGVDSEFALSDFESAQPR